MYVDRHKFQDLHCFVVVHRKGERLVKVLSLSLESLCRLNEEEWNKNMLLQIPARIDKCSNYQLAGPHAVK